MKIHLHPDYMSITAMATINPQMCKDNIIRIEVVQSNEGPNPHVHVYSGSGKSGKCSYISLTDAKYAEHHGNCPKLTKREKEQFVKIMSAIWSKYWIELYRLDGFGRRTSETYAERATGYEAAVQIWCDTYAGSESKFNYDESGRPIMPDYSKLETS